MNKLLLRNLIKKWLPSGMVHAIQQWLLSRSVAEFKSHIARHRYGIHELSVCIGDNLAQGWYDHDWAQPEEITLLKQWSLKPGALVFDLGAHQGVVAMLLAVECSPGGRVVAVEGSSHNVLMARKNAGLNHVESIQILHAVVGEEHGGEICFSSTLNGHVRNDGVGERVPQVSIDGLAAQYGMPDVVFVDIEGYECQALAGAQTVLKRGADFFVEVHVGAGLEENGTVEQVFGSFPSSRYLLQVSAGEEMPFSLWNEGDALPDRKFFLVATLKN